MSHLQIFFLIFFYSNSFCLYVPETTNRLPSVLFCRKMLTLLLFGHKINLFIIYICLFSTLGCFFLSMIDLYIYCLRIINILFKFSQGRLLSWPNGLVACPFWCSSFNLYYNIVVYSSHQINKFFFFFFFSLFLC